MLRQGCPAAAVPNAVASLVTGLTSVANRQTPTDCPRFFSHQVEGLKPCLAVLQQVAKAHAGMRCFLQEAPLQTKAQPTTFHHKHCGRLAERKGVRAEISEACLPAPDAVIYFIMFCIICHSVAHSLGLQSCFRNLLAHSAWRCFCKHLLRTLLWPGSLRMGQSPVSGLVTVLTRHPLAHVSCLRVRVF